MSKSLYQSDFYIKIQYERETPYPQRVFISMANLIEAWQIFDQNLLYSLPIKVDHKYVLSDITTGSLVGRLKNIVESLDDDALKKLDWKPLVGNYLVKAKYATASFLTKLEKEWESKKLLRLSV